ncbi:hypothetical protein WICPIJ_006521 [Wickerhamomyces pijperi]|uniref:Uncharacterized protein n=1 Tax=Wickerhamomyces pijperi TaxID=599730 RepID=A0A9P8TLA8_WICPI|nr:hypothetical protein WICPIJ_006521 [Wickerhamomyces pijperi]
MSDINITPSQNTLDAKSTPANIAQSSEGGKIRDSKLIDYLSEIRTQEAKCININSMTPLIAISILDFLVKKLIKDSERDEYSSEDYNPHEDPVISRLLAKGLEGNFGELPSHSKKRGRESESPPPGADKVNIVFDICKFKKTTESPFTSPPISSTASPSDSNTAPSSPALINTKQNELLTKRFMLKTPPALNSTEYLDRIHQYCQFSTAVYLSSAYYIYKLVVDLKLLKVTKLNVHRLLITAIRVGCKVVEDMKHRQEFIAKIGGLNMKDLLALEISFLFLIKFECQVNQDLMTSLVGYIRDTHSHMINLGT